MHLADPLAHLHQHVGGRFEAPRHLTLRVARQLPRGSDARLQLRADLPELLRHRLRQLPDLRVDLRRHRLALRGKRILHFLPHGGELRVGPAARRPHDRAHRHDCQDACDEPGKKVIAIHFSANRPSGEAVWHRQSCLCEAMRVNNEIKLGHHRCLKDAPAC